MGRTLRGLLVLVGLAVGLSALPPSVAASTSQWCGTDPGAVDQPDVASAFQIHLIYAVPSDAPDRFQQLAPIIAADQEVIHEWWQRQDPTRAPRYDFFSAPGCPTRFGALDISHVRLPGPSSDYANNTWGPLQDALALTPFTFTHIDKLYVVYFDGLSNNSACGGALRNSFPFNGSGPVGLFLNCPADPEFGLNTDARRWVSLHEMLHGLGADVYYGKVGPPHADAGGHVTDDSQDVMSSVRPVELRLDALHLDAARDDYYGHTGSWWDVRNSFFLERLDAPGSGQPSPPTNFEATNRPLRRPAPPGVPVAGQTNANLDPLRILLSWRPPGESANGSFLVTRDDGRAEVSVTKPLMPLTSSFISDWGVMGAKLRFQVQTVTADGYLSVPVAIRFQVGLGIIDEKDHLLVDTVPPAPVLVPVRVLRRRDGVLLRWEISYAITIDPAGIPRLTADPGGILGWRVCVGGSCRLVRHPRIALSPRRVRGKVVSIVVVDRAGNRSRPLRLRPMP